MESNPRPSELSAAKQYSENIKRILLDYQYIDAVTKFDNASHNDQIVQYFSIIGMNDPDILHSVMTIKEMIQGGYCLNGDDLDNSGVLTGNRPFIAKTKEEDEVEEEKESWRASTTRDTAVGA